MPAREAAPISITGMTTMRLTSIVVLIALAALAPSASARPIDDPVQARDGRYGAVEGVEYVGFRVRDRRISQLYFNTTITCTASDTGEANEAFFDGVDLGGGRVRDNGVWSRNFVVDSNGRRGEVNAEVDFRRAQPLASFAIIVPGYEEESCHGFGAIRARRGA